MRLRLAFAALVGLTLAAPGGTAASDGASQETRVTVYRAYSGARVAPQLHVAGTAKGACFTGSIADPRADAWRCSAGNEILDPCFSNRTIASWVLCPLDGTPFGTMVLRLALSKALPSSLRNTGSAGAGNPWAIQLGGGRECTFLTGATFLYHGRRVNYGCDRKTFLAGNPDRRSSTWTITLGTGPKSKPRTVPIAIAAW